MSQNINSTARHSNFTYILLFTNLLRTDNETKRKVKKFKKIKKIKKVKKDKK